jgi:Mg2+ and Co2+ transporter CorA
MMWAYAFKARKVHATDVSSLSESQTLRKQADWLWVDCFEPGSDDFEITSKLFCHDAKIMDDMRNGKPFPRYQKHGDCTFLSVSVAAVQSTLRTYPIYIAVKGKTVLTVRTEGSSRPVEHAIQTLKDCIAEVEKTGPFLVVCEVLREASNENLEVLMALREKIEKVEEEVISNPSKRVMAKRIFELKREIAVFYRLLWSEEQMMSSIKDGLIPNLEPCEENLSGLQDAMSNVSRELEFLNSYDSALDGVLTIQDLGMIHRVETTLIYLTVAIVITNLILILVELAF